MPPLQLSILLLNHVASSVLPYSSDHTPSPQPTLAVSDGGLDPSWLKGIGSWPSSCDTTRTTHSHPAAVLCVFCCAVLSIPLPPRPPHPTVAVCDGKPDPSWLKGKGDWPASCEITRTTKLCTAQCSNYGFTTVRCGVGEWLRESLYGGCSDSPGERFVRAGRGYGCRGCCKDVVCTEVLVTQQRAGGGLWSHSSSSSSSSSSSWVWPIFLCW